MLSTIYFRNLVNSTLFSTIFAFHAPTLRQIFVFHAQTLRQIIAFHAPTLRQISAFHAPTLRQTHCYIADFKTLNNIYRKSQF
jgi:hypothetical protein